MAERDSAKGPHPRDLPELLDLVARARDLQRGYANGDPEARRRVLENAPPWTRAPDGGLLGPTLTNVDANQVIARELGFDHWGELANDYEREPDPDFERAIDFVVEGDTAALRAALKARPELATAHSSRRHRGQLVHYVASNGVEDEKQKVPANAVEIAETLFAAGADPDALAATYDGSRSQTPLYLHCSSSHPTEHGLHGPLVEAFCRAGAKPNGLDDDGLPLDTAIRFGYPEAAEALVRMGARVDSVVRAAALGDVDGLERGFAGEQRPPREFCVPRARVWPFDWPREVEEEAGTIKAESACARALSYAAMHGRMGAVAFLLDRGIDANHSAERNERALHWAAFRGHRDIVELLLDRGARVSDRDDRWFCTPVGWAREAKHTEIVDLLASRAALDLMDACDLGSTVRVREILQGNEEPPDGPRGLGIPLRCAAHGGHLEIVEILLVAGARADLTNPAGKTALDWAVECGHGDVAERLRRVMG